MLTKSVIVNTRVFTGVLFLCATKVVAQALPIATQFELPIRTAWNPGQAVGAYHHISDGGGGYTLCGKHLGQDVSAPALTTAVYAIADGRVRRSEDVAGLGHAVQIEHLLPDGTYITSVYYHLLRRAEGGIELTDGALIRRGDQVGILTNNAEDNFGTPHLHFGIRLEGTSGYRGKYTLDTRTRVHFYPGYSTHKSSTGARRCEIIGVAADRAQADHDIIVAEWVNDPQQFILDRLAPPSAQVTFEIRGTVTQIPNPTALAADSAAYGFAPGFVQIGDPFTFRYTVNTIAPDQDAHFNSGAYRAIVSATLTTPSGTHSWTPMTLPQPGWLFLLNDFACSGTTPGGGLCDRYQGAVQSAFVAPYRSFLATIFLEDADESAFVSDQIPASLDGTPFESMWFTTGVANGNGADAVFAGTISSVVRVP